MLLCLPVGKHILLLVQEYLLGSAPVTEQVGFPTRSLYWKRSQHHYPAFLHFLVPFGSITRSHLSWLGCLVRPVFSKCFGPLLTFFSIPYLAIFSWLYPPTSATHISIHTLLHLQNCNLSIYYLSTTSYPTVCFLLWLLFSDLNRTPNPLIPLLAAPPHQTAPPLTPITKLSVVSVSTH